MTWDEAARARLEAMDRRVRHARALTLEQSLDVLNIVDALLAERDEQRRQWWETDVALRQRLHAAETERAQAAPVLAAAEAYVDADTKSYKLAVALAGAVAAWRAAREG